jgi:hypothetical protein
MAASMAAHSDGRLFHRRNPGHGALVLNRIEGATMAKKSAAITLTEAQQELLATNAKLSDTSRRRDQLLLAGDERELDRIEAEVANLQRQHERSVARIRLLEQQIEQDEADAVLQRRKAHVARFAKKLNDADQVADEVQGCIEQLDKLYRKLITLREDARVAWWGSTPHEMALSISPDGCALSGLAVKAMLMHEIYRCGARPFVGGTPGELKQVDLPGGQCPDHRLLGQPHLIEPFGARMRKASAAAIDVMKAKVPGGESGASIDVPDTPPAPSGNGAPPSPAHGDQPTLAALLKQQAALAEDMSEEGERRYNEVVKRIAELSP